MTSATVDTYRAMRRPAAAGDVRLKVWRFLIPPASPDDPEWANRCRTYWALQQETFGLVFGGCTMEIDWDEMLVISSARVERVLPGERVEGFIAPRAGG
jgi:hypothetical protein